MQNPMDTRPVIQSSLTDVSSQTFDYDASLESWLGGAMLQRRSVSDQMRLIWCSMALTAVPLSDEGSMRIC
jgi:hypothetical protein